MKCSRCNGTGIVTTGRTHDAGGRKLYGPRRNRCYTCRGTGKKKNITPEGLEMLQNTIKVLKDMGELDASGG